MGQVERELRQVLARMSVVSEASAGAAVAGRRGGKASSRILKADGESLYDEYARRLRGCRTPSDLEALLAAAEDALESVRGHLQREPTLREDGWQARMLNETGGLHPAKVSVRWDISTAYVRKLRRDAGLDPKTGEAR